jgi:hypothetical protein
MADIKAAYGSSSALTITVASLATSSDFTAGRESAAVVNTTNLYRDYLFGGKVTTGTSPTADKEIRIYVYGSYNDTPDYIDVLDGSDSAETITDPKILQTMRLLKSLPTDDTSDQTYYLSPVGIAQYFGGIVPKQWGIFLAHNTGVALNSTAANHEFYYTGVYDTVS